MYVSVSMYIYIVIYTYIDIPIGPPTSVIRFKNTEVNNCCHFIKKWGDPPNCCQIIPGWATFHWKSSNRNCTMLVDRWKHLRNQTQIVRTSTATPADWVHHEYSTWSQKIINIYITVHGNIQVHKKTKRWPKSSNVNTIDFQPIQWCPPVLWVGSKAPLTIYINYNIYLP